MPATDLVTSADEHVLRAVADLRRAPLTAVMTLLSAWWVKGVVIAALGVAADLRRRPRRLPRTLIPALAAMLVASWSSSALKAVFDRARPPAADPSLTALVPLPADASFPSGHAATAFAAAGVVALLHPRLRVPALGLAALVALSRVYLGVHFPSDVIAGAALGLAVAAVTVRVPFARALRAATARRARPSTAP